jgi:hypothetical protein
MRGMNREGSLAVRKIGKISAVGGIRTNILSPLEKGKGVGIFGKENFYQEVKNDGLVKSQNSQKSPCNMM